MRATLGRMSCTASELQAQSGPDAEAIRRIVRLEGARPRAACHLCEGLVRAARIRAPTFGMAALRPACEAELGGVAMERSAHLAVMGDSLCSALLTGSPAPGGQRGGRETGSGDVAPAPRL